MNTTFAHTIRLFFEARLDPAAGSGVLEKSEEVTLGALYTALCDDDAHDTSGYFSALRARTQQEPGLLVQFQKAAALLQEISRKKFSRPFEALKADQKDVVLGQLLSGNVSRLSESNFKNRLKMTRWHIDQIVCAPAKRAFRQFVSADMLLDYFRTEKGWGLVGYREYPGRVRGEWEPCEVVRVHFEGDDILLELSDLTFDKLRSDALQIEGEDSLIAVTKYGRQRAKFSRAAYNTLTELLESDGDEMLIRRGNREWKIETL